MAVAVWRRRASGLMAAGILVVLAVASAAAVADRPDSKPGVRVWRRVHITEPVAASMVREALDRASALLAQPRCQSLFTDFRDSRGPLIDRLDALGVDPLVYLTMIVFVDDTRHPSCMPGVMAFTVPGSRVVRLCGVEVKRTWSTSSNQVVAALIHEMLHTLGLRENPPSSREITRQVLNRCRE